MSRKFSDESYGIGQQERKVVYNYLSHRSVKGGEKFVLGEDLALAEKIHNRRFTDVRISDESDARQFSTVLTLNRFLAVDMPQLLLETRDFVENYTSVGLNLSLTGTTHTYTSALTLKVSPESGQTREQVLILGQLDLSTCGSRLSAFGEDIKNQTGAVKNLHLQLPLYIGNLLWREVVVEDDESYIIILDIFLNLFQLTLSDVCSGIGIIHFLYEAGFGFRSGSGCKKGEFVKILLYFCLGLLLGDKSDEDGPLACFLIYDVVFYHFALNFL